MLSIEVIKKLSQLQSLFTMEVVDIAETHNLDANELMKKCLSSITRVTTNLDLNRK